MTVIPSSLVWITQNGMRIRNLLETFGCFFQIVRVFVWTSTIINKLNIAYIILNRIKELAWVPFQCKLSIGSLNIIRISVSSYP